MPAQFIKVRVSKYKPGKVMQVAGGGQPQATQLVPDGSTEAIFNTATILAIQSVDDGARCMIVLAGGGTTQCEEPLATVWSYLI